MKSYFFIPATRLRKISAIQKAGADFTIIDFEDAILKADIGILFDEMINFCEVKDSWFRIPVRNSFEENLDLEYIDKFKAIGVKKIVVPKLKCTAELITIIEMYKDLKFIILIEHPKLLL